MTFAHIFSSLRNNTTKREITKALWISLTRGSCWSSRMRPNSTHVSNLKAKLNQVGESVGVL